MTDLQEKMGYTFAEPSWLQQSLTHRSYHFENLNESKGDNERLEFLGDAVLSLILTAWLVREFPADPEGALSKKRASLVNADVLAALGRELDLDKKLRLGRGERLTGGESKPRLLASAVEAVIGAVYVDGGIDPATAFVTRLFAERLARLGSAPDYGLDYKTRLQERIQEKHRIAPTYQVMSETGPDHDKQFEVSVRLKDQVLATGHGRSKKMAEQEAARKALENMS